MAVDYVELAAAAFGCSKAELLSFKENPDTVVVILPSGQKHKLRKEYLLAVDAARLRRSRRRRAGGGAEGEAPGSDWRKAPGGAGAARRQNKLRPGFTWCAGGQVSLRSKVAYKRKEDCKVSATQ